MPPSDQLRAEHLSRFAHRSLEARAELRMAVMARLDQAWTAPSLHTRLNDLLAANASHAHDDTLKTALRKLRAEVLLSLMERDLRGNADLAEVTETMTLLAEIAVQRALAVLDAELQALYGRPTGMASGEPQELLVVGMGKLGGRELNVSSDIDLIFLYDEEGETVAPPGETRRSISNHEYFIKLGRKLINALADVTPDGYVFRVDMRLRPNGDSGPLACSLAMLEEYFMVQGREWERYAWIKGRVISDGGNIHAQRAIQQLDALVRPFVFRRYLDFGVIEAIRALHAQIRTEAGKKASNGYGNGAAPNIKLGRGGIREIEFLAQMHQLIRGGQDGALRVRPTLQVLARVSERGLLDPRTLAELTDAYVFLRNLEHRLQYLDDAQTHSLPASDEDRARVAAMMGFADYAAMLGVLANHQEAVAALFESHFSDKQEALPEAKAALWGSALEDEAQQLALSEPLLRWGIADPGEVLERLRAAWRSPRLRALGEGSRQRLDALVPRALELACRQRQPGDTIARVLTFFEAISRRASYLSLLCEYPQALTRLIDTLGASRWAADYLTRHPQLLDELLDDRASDAASGDPASLAAWRDALRAELTQRLREADGHVEMQMDLLRQTHHAETFRVLLLDLQQRISVEQIGDRLSALADTLLDITLEQVWAQLASRHRDTPRFAVIAYGRLGGKELGYASDLDIVFLYDDEDERAPQVYAHYARRLINWMTSHTAAGMLFDIDTRLRPNGEAGLLVTSLEAFRRYQLREGDNAAWVWEHQALTRARFCAGDAEIGARFEAIRNEVLCQARHAQQLARDIVEMRAKVAAGHPNPSESFDLKHDRGGMVDIEFTVQYLVLLHSRAHPQLTRNAGNIALLRLAGEAGLIDPGLADRVADAYREFRARQHVLRLDGANHARVPRASVAAQTVDVCELWLQVFGETGMAH